MRFDQLIGYVIIAIVSFVMGEVVEWLRERRQDRQERLDDKVRQVVEETLTRVQAERSGRAHLVRKQGNTSGRPGTAQTHAMAVRNVSQEPSGAGWSHQGKTYEECGCDRSDLHQLLAPGLPSKAEFPHRCKICQEMIRQGDNEGLMKWVCDVEWTMGHWSHVDEFNAWKALTRGGRQ